MCVCVCEWYNFFKDITNVKENQSLVKDQVFPILPDVAQFVAEVDLECKDLYLEYLYSFSRHM